MRALQSLLIASALGALGCTQSQPRPPEWISRSEDGPFVVQLFLTDDFERTVREWQVPTSPSLTTLSSARVGTSVSTVFLVSNCTPDTAQNCRVIFDVTLVDQGGNITKHTQDAPLCRSEPAPPPNHFMLCGGHAVITYDGHPKKFRVVTDVRDQNSDRSAHLEVPLEFQ